MVPRSACALALLLVALSRSCLPAQGPLRLEAPGLVLVAPPSKRNVAIDFLNTWPGAKARVQAVIGGPVPDRVTLELVAGEDGLSGRARELTGSDLPEWVGGFALPERDLVVIRTDLRGPRAERITGIFTHELAHLALAHRLRSAGAPPAPRWLDEGVAQLAEGRLFLEEVPSLPMRAFFGQLIALQELETHFPASEGASALAYAEALSFVEFVSRNVADGSIRGVIDRLAEHAPVASAIELTAREPFGVLEARWREELRGDKSWMLGFASQIAFGLFLVVALMLGARRIVGKRRDIEARWEQAEAAAQESEDEEYLEEGESEVGESEPPSRSKPLPRYPGWMGIRRRRQGDEDPVV